MNASDVWLEEGESFASRLESQRRACRFLPGLRRSEIPGLSLPDMHSIRFRAMTVSPMIREPLSLATCPVICRKPFVIRSTGSRGKMWHCRNVRQNPLFDLNAARTFYIIASYCHRVDGKSASNCSSAADASAAALGETAFADFASARNQYVV